MSPEFEQFLAERDLDLAAHALDAVTDISREDAAGLAGVILAWGPPQALANMLMQPATIPVAHRLSALLRGLATDVRQYPLVAAVVGLRAIQVPDDYRRAVGNRLVDLAATEGGPVSGLASSTLAAYLLDVDTQHVLVHFDQFGETARHNVLFGLLDALGDDDLRSHVRLARTRGTLSEATAAEIGQRLEALGAQGGGLYVLDRIPSLTEWDARPAPAGYPD